MKILITQFGNETNTFATGLTDFNKLVPGGWTRANDVVRLFNGTSTYLGGALKAIEEEGVEVLPIDLSTNGGNFGAGPLMSAECSTYAMDHITDQVKKHIGEFDGIFFAVHGAGCAENTDDLEAYSFKRMREVIGDIPMMSSLDVHGNITDEMLALSDGLFSIKQNPHTDCKEAGYLATKMLIAKIRGTINPKMALRRLPLLIPPTDPGSTLNEPGRSIVSYLENYVKENNLIDATFFFGFPYMDRPCSSVSVLVVANDFVPDKQADDLSKYIWEKRNEFVVESLSPSEAIDRALKLVKDGYVVINEGSDNPGGGTPGDATHLLREMVKRDMKGFIMGPIYDPKLAESLHNNHKIGDKVTVLLGGKTDPELCGDPVLLEDATIVNFSDGKIVSQAPLNKGAQMDYGKSVRLRHGNIEVIVVSIRFQVYDDRPFIMTGVDLAQYKVIGLKSMNHFKGYFMSRADAIVPTDPPGQCPSNLKLLKFKQIHRPMLPLDENVEYTGHWPLDNSKE